MLPPAGSALDGGAQPADRGSVVVDLGPGHVVDVLSVERHERPVSKIKRAIERHHPTLTGCRRSPQRPERTRRRGPIAGEEILGSYPV